MNVQQSKYYFSTYFTWWVFHLMFPLTDELEEQLDEDLLDKVDDLFIESEDVGEWFSDEPRKAGIAFILEGKKESVYACTIQYESEIQNMFDALSEFAKGNKNDYHRYLFYAQCKLLGKIILEYGEYIRTLQVEEYEDSYLPNAELVAEFLSWLDKTIAELKNDLVETRDSELDRLLADLARDWVILVEKVAQKHLPE